MRSQIAPNRSGADGEIEGANAVGMLGEHGGEIRPTLLASRVERHVHDARQEPVERHRVPLGLGDELLQPPVHGLDIGARGFLAARYGDDPRLGRDLAREIAVIERRHQLAGGKVSGRTEDDHVEGFD